MIEERLSDLYSIAFSRQLSYHLGFSNDSHSINSTSFPDTAIDTNNQKRSISPIGTGTLFNSGSDIKRDNVQLFNDMNIPHSVHKRNIDLSYNAIGSTDVVKSSSYMNNATSFTIQKKNSDRNFKTYERYSEKKKKETKDKSTVRYVSVIVHNISHIEDDKDYVDEQIEPINVQSK